MRSTCVVTRRANRPMSSTLLGWQAQQCPTEVGSRLDPMNDGRAIAPSRAPLDRLMVYPPTRGTPPTRSHGALRRNPWLAPLAAYSHLADVQSEDPPADHRSPSSASSCDDAQVRKSSSSRLSLWSQDSFLSIASKGSVLSVGSVGSVLSVASIGSALSVLSVGSVASIGALLSARSRWSIMSSKAARRVLSVQH
jgi:hypothetical protein